MSFCPVRPDVLQIIALVAGSQALSAFSCGNFSIVAKKGMGHWWNDTERENSKYSEKTPMPVLMCPAQNSHGLS